jgi:L-ornithine N5-oxygenase
MRANYAAVDREAVSALYRTIYEDELLDRRRIRMLPSTTVTGAYRDDGGRYVLDTTNSLDGARLTVTADIVVLATGYVTQPLPTVFAPLRPGLRRDELGHPVVNYDFSLAMADGADPVVFAPSAGEPSHGLASSSSFSMVALKAERVTKALAAKGVLDATAAVRIPHDAMIGS